MNKSRSTQNMVDWQLWIMKLVISTFKTEVEMQDLEEVKMHILLLLNP